MLLPLIQGCLLKPLCKSGIMVGGRRRSVGTYKDENIINRQRDETETLGFRLDPTGVESPRTRVVSRTGSRSPTYLLVYSLCHPSDVEKVRRCPGEVRSGNVYEKGEGPRGQGRDQRTDWEDLGNRGGRGR